MWHVSCAVLDELVEVVEKLGLVVEQLHAESAHGQFEIVTSHEEPLKVPPHNQNNFAHHRLRSILPCPAVVAF